MGPKAEGWRCPGGRRTGAPKRDPNQSRQQHKIQQFQNTFQNTESEPNGQQSTQKVFESQEQEACQQTGKNEEESQAFMLLLIRAVVDEGDERARAGLWSGARATPGQGTTPKADRKEQEKLGGLALRPTHWHWPQTGGITTKGSLIISIQRNLWNGKSWNDSRGFTKLLFQAPSLCNFLKIKPKRVCKVLHAVTKWVLTPLHTYIIAC